MVGRLRNVLTVKGQEKYMTKNFSARKLFLNLLVIVCLGVAGWTGYQLFVLHELSPVSGSVIFIVDIGVLVWNISVLRSSHHRWKTPSFKLTFFSLLGIALVLAFAGIQPLAEYKDRMLSLIPSGGVSTLPQQEAPLVPYGTYKHTLGAWEQILTLNSNGTYEAMGTIIPFTAPKLSSGSIDRGTYRIDLNYLYITPDITGHTAKYKYRYSSEFQCLYIYTSSYSETPEAFYKR